VTTTGCRPKSKRGALVESDVLPPSFLRCFVVLVLLTLDLRKCNSRLHLIRFPSKWFAFAAGVGA
jgi:hypothetical protein